MKLTRKEKLQAKELRLYKSTAPKYAFAEQLKVYNYYPNLVNALPLVQQHLTCESDQDTLLNTSLQVVQQVPYQYARRVRVSRRALHIRNS